jgi:hypothetical protein
MRPANDWAWHIEEVRVELIKKQERIHALEKALKEIADGDGYYGQQAREYKQIAQAALACSAPQNSEK